MKQVITGKPSQGWIFSPKEDFLVFWGPTFLALLVLFVSKQMEFSIIYSFFWILVAQGFINMGHVFSSVSPLYQLIKLKKIKNSSVVLFLAIIGVFSFNFAFHAPLVFVHFVLFTQIIHVGLQNYGWLNISRKKDKDISSKFFDTIFLFNCMAPLQWAYSSITDTPTMFAGVGIELERPYIMPDEWFFSFFIMHWVINFTYVFYCFYLYKFKGKIYTAKNLFFLSLWVVFYGAFAVFESIEFFLIATALNHALSYLLQVKKVSFLPVAGQEVYKSKKKWNLVFFTMIIIIGLVWTFVLESSLNSSLMVLIFWFPSLVHNIGDGYLWKSRNWKFST